MNPLPKHLRISKEGSYYLDWRVKEGGMTKRKQMVIGKVPKAQALLVHAQFYKDMVNKRLGLAEKKSVSFREAATSYLSYSESNKRSYKDDVFLVDSLVKYFADNPLEELNLDSVESYKVQRR